MVPPPWVQWGLDHRLNHRTWNRPLNQPGAGARAGTCDHSNKDGSVLSQDPECARLFAPPPFVSAQLRGRGCVVVPEFDKRSQFGSRGTEAGALALTLRGGRDRLREGRGGPVEAGRPELPGFPTERLRLETQSTTRRLRVLGQSGAFLPRG